jgi:hypothetical protein
MTVEHGFVTRVKQQVPLVEQELLTLLEHLSSPQVFSRVCVTQSLVLCVMFCRSLFVLFFCDGIICPSSIYGFSLPLWYLQTLLKKKQQQEDNNILMYMYITNVEVKI